MATFLPDLKTTRKYLISLIAYGLQLVFNSIDH